MASKTDYMTINITGVSHLAPENKKENKKEKEEKPEITSNWLDALLTGAEFKKPKTGSALTQSVKYVASQTKQTITTAVSMGWNRYTTLQEDYIAENRINNIETSLNTVKSISEATIQGANNGAKLGSAIGGPVGGAIGYAVGAVTGVAFWGVNQHLKNQQKLSGYYQQLNQTNFQTYLDSSRAGLVDNGRGTQN
jgi:outer membrane lipoprotein SlyB